MPIDFEDLALRQRACRRFDVDADVPDEDVHRILTIAVHAPSAENSQPWEFVVVRSPETRAAFSAASRARWRSGGGEAVRQAVAPKVFADMEDGIDKGGLESAPVVIVVCLDTDRVRAEWGPSSVYPATQNILLAAGALGYGSCLTTGLTARSTDRVRELLELPPHVLPMACVFVGRPARALGRPKRRPAALHTHRETFGRLW
jgi:nitroreductase